MTKTRRKRKMMLTMSNYFFCSGEAREVKMSEGEEGG